MRKMTKIRVHASFKKFFMGIFGIIAIVVVYPTSAAFIGIGEGGNIYSINETAGSMTFIGPSGFSGNSMAKNSAGTLFSADIRLFTVDPVSGAGTPVINLPFRGRGLRGMAFNSSDTLYGIDSVAEVDVDDFLVTVNTATGAVTTIGTNVGFSGVQGLAFAPDGTLYGWDIFYGLLTVDPATGVATDVNASVGINFNNIQSLAFDDNGTLYGVRDNLYLIDRFTGVSTLIGAGNSMPFDIRGFEFVPSAVPIPAAVWLFGSGLLGLIGVARRRNVRRVIR